MDTEEKIIENMNKIYGIVFEQCTPIIQSVFKGIPNYEKKSTGCDYLWIMEELNKIMAGLDAKKT